MGIHQQNSAEEAHRIMAPSTFNLNKFFEDKFGKLEKTSFQKQNVSGRSNSMLSDLVKFNTSLAHTSYKIRDEAILETMLYAMQPEKDIKDLDLSSAVSAAYQEVPVQGPPDAGGPAHHHPGAEALPVDPHCSHPLPPCPGSAHGLLPGARYKAHWEEACQGCCQGSRRQDDWQGQGRGDGLPGHHAEHCRCL